MITVATGMGSRMLFFRKSCGDGVILTWILYF